MRLINKNFYILFWLCTFYSIEVQSQSYFEAYKNLSDSFDDNQSKNKVIIDSLIQLSKNKDKSIEAYQISHDYSLVCFYNNHFEDAINYAKKAVIIKRDNNEYDNDYVNSLFRVGYFSSQATNYNEAFIYFDKIIKLGKNPHKIALSYCEIGYNFYTLNDYYKSIFYLKKGITELKLLGKNKDILNAYESLSMAYNEISTETSLKHQLETIKKADSLEKITEVNLTYRLRINNSYATFYSNKLSYNFEKARFYLKNNLHLSLENGIDDIACSTYNNLANIYNLEKKDSAVYYANKGISKCTYTQSLSRSYFQKSDYYKNKGDYKKGLNNIQTGINIILNSNLSIDKPIQLKLLQDNNDKDQLLFMLTRKNKLLFLRSEQERNQVYSELALQHTLVADSLVDIIQAEIINSTKLHWRLKASEIYTQGTELCYYLHKPEIAFYLSEKGKSLLLSQAILKNKAISKLPDDIKSKELKLKKSFVHLTSKEVNNKFQAELDYEAYIDSIKVEYSQYFNNESFQNIIPLNTFKEKIDQNTVVISYLWPNAAIGGNTVYALFITNEITELLKIGNSENISDLINSYQELISKPITTTKNQDIFNDIAHQLYTKLFQPKNIKTNIDDKNFILIPDGKLQNIPFEALTTSKDDLNYLIKKHTISYAYSLSFLEQNKKIERNSINNFVGFAPEKFNSLNLDPLENSVYEIHKASEITNGITYINNKATKSSFLNNASDSKIIHLATHGDASGDPWIAFSDKKLSLQELYTFKNNAELTVLSGCDTSLGKISEGEGVMSLARGFFYSGSNSVVASLWNINDKSTTFLMDNFYKNLKSGQSKAKALQNAKLDYIESHSLSEASPYYWSSFILLGDTKSIDLERGITTLHYFISGFILIITTLLLYLYKYKKNE